MVRRRVLARQLKQLREEAGLTLEEAAPKLDFSVSRLSRIENAQILIDVHWVRGMLDLRWFTSSFSGGSGEGCVEVAFVRDGGVAVRDTKDRTLPPHRYSAASWAEFLTGIRAGDFGRQ